MFLRKGLSYRPKPALSPHDCALLFGIPMDKASFIRKIQGPRDGNFADSFRASRIELAWAGYKPLADRLNCVADEAERLGVHVFRRMQLSDIRSACEFSAVTIISHWRSAQFKPDDICDPHKLSWALEQTKRQATDEGQVEVLVKALNDIMLAQLPSPDGSLGFHIQLQSLLEERRREITSKSPGAFRGGSGIEFDAGFESVSAIADRVPAGFTGVFDLTVCNSVLLAEILHQRCPHCLVIATSDVTYPETRLPLYSATIRLLDRHPLPYEDAVHNLQSVLRRAFR